MSDPTPPFPSQPPGPPPLAPPVLTPPGALPPGGFPPGSYPPGAYPPGTYPPGPYAPQQFGPPRKTGRTIAIIIACVVVGLILVVGGLIAILLPSLNKAREQSNRVKCGNNLKRIGEGLTLYGNENNNRLPRTFYSSTSPVSLSFDPTGAAASDAFTGGNPVGVNNVSAALFLLIRTQDLGSEVFTCPSSTETNDTYAGGRVSNRSNFTASSNLSYAFANPYPDAAAYDNGYRWTTGLGAEFAVAGDRAAMAIKKTNVASTQTEQRTGNSPNHGNDGQEVLFGDFHVEWTTNANVGISRDNIYFPNGVTPNLGPVPGTLGSNAADDSLLLPRK